MKKKVLDYTLSKYIARLINGYPPEEARATIAVLQEINRVGDTTNVDRGNDANNIKALNQLFREGNDFDKWYIQAALNEIKDRLFDKELFEDTSLISTQTSRYTLRAAVGGVVMASALYFFLLKPNLVEPKLSYLHAIQERLFKSKNIIEFLRNQASQLQLTVMSAPVHENLENATRSLSRLQQEQVITEWFIQFRKGAAGVVSSLAGGVTFLKLNSRNYDTIIHTVLSNLPYEEEKLHKIHKLQVRKDRQEQAFLNLINNTLSLIIGRPSSYCYISYAWELGGFSGNKELHARLKKLKSILGRLSCTVFLDVHHMNGVPGEIMPREIAKADVVLLICTPRLLERLQDQSTSVAEEFRLGKEKILNGTSSFKIIPLVFSKASNTIGLEDSVPVDIRNPKVNSLAIDFTSFTVKNDLVSRHATYKAVAARTYLIDRLHFSGESNQENSTKYGKFYDEYKQERSLKPTQPFNSEIDSDLSDDELAPQPQPLNGNGYGV